MNLLLQRLHEHATTRANQLAYHEVATGKSLTWLDLNDRVEAFARELAAQFPKGSRLILRHRNNCDYVVAFLGIARAAHTLFPVPADITAAELNSLVARSHAAGIIGIDLAITKLEAQPHVHDERSLLLQSSGTTGLPKIVRRSAVSIDAVCDNMFAAISPTADDRFLSVVPLCHSYGLEHGILLPISCGAAVHLIDGFNYNDVRQQLTGGGITILPGVPSMFEMIANLAPDDLRNIRLAYSAGAALPKSVIDRLPIRIGQVYGASEFGSATFNDPREQPFDPISAGRPYRGVEVKICDGQLLIRADSMFSGYIDSSTDLVGGFFPTGDLAEITSDNLTITGRTKLLIDVGGLKVNPLEVEAILNQHPAVKESVILPVRVSDTVSRIKAIITPRDEASPPDENELRQFAKSRLSSHKIPRIFEFRGNLPKSPTGKILRHLCACVVLLFFLIGCASTERIPHYTAATPAQAISMIAQRTQSIHTLTATAEVTLLRPDGESVRLDAAMVTRGDDQLRLRAWKFGQAVFDLTMKDDALYLATSENSRMQEQIRSAGLSAAKFARAWGVITGQMFLDQPRLVSQSSSQFTFASDDVTCIVDRQSLTPRQYEMTKHFVVTLDHYAKIGDIVFPRRIIAKSPDGTVTIEMRDLEINGELAATAFIPPKRAEKLP